MDQITSCVSQLNNKRGYLSVFLAINGVFILLCLLLFFLNLWIIPVVAYSVSLFLITFALLWYSRGECCPCIGARNASDEPRMCTTPKNLREGGEGDGTDDLKLRMRAWRDERSACIIDMTPIPLLSDESPRPQRQPSTGLEPVHSPSAETFMTASSTATEGATARSPIADPSPPVTFRQSGGRDPHISSSPHDRGLPTVSEYVEKYCEDRWTPQNPCDRIPALSDSEPPASISSHKRFPWKLKRPAFRQPGSLLAKKTSSTTTTTTGTATTSSSSSSSDARYNMARRAMGRMRHALHLNKPTTDSNEKLKPETNNVSFNSRILMEEEDMFRIPFYQYKT